MTLGQAKSKALMLMDEYSSSGALTVDRDIDLKMNAFFDTAQKQLSLIKRIIRRYDLPLAEGVTLYPMPADFLSVRGVYIDSSPVGRGVWNGSSLLLANTKELLRGHSVQVEYNAMPSSITDSTDDSYVFEIAQDAQECMPYFVASQQLIVDLVVDHRALLSMYDRMVAALDAPVRAQVSGGVRFG